MGSWFFRIVQREKVGGRERGVGREKVGGRERGVWREKERERGKRTKGLGSKQQWN